MSYLSSAQVAEKIGTTPGNLRLMRKRGKFPEPDLAPSSQILLWAVTTVDQWLENGRTMTSDDTTEIRSDVKAILIMTGELTQIKESLWRIEQLLVKLATPSGVLTLPDER